MAVFDFAAVAARYGEAPAVRDRESALSYAALGERVDARAGALRRAGLAPGAGTRVALACGRDIATVVDALALVALECAILPHSAAATTEEAERLFARFRPAWIVRAEDREAVRWSNAGAEGAARKRASADGDSRGNARASGASESHASLIDALSPHEIALALPSSGSTGTPKLILISPSQLRERIELRARSIGLRENERMLAVIPFDHGYGFTNVMLGTLAHGMSLVIVETPDPRQSPHPRAVIDALHLYEATLMPAPPILLDLMTRFARSDRADAGREGARAGGIASARQRAGAGVSARALMPLSLRAAISVGSALSREVHAAFTETFGVPLWQSYGASEVGPAIINKSGVADGDLLALGEPVDGVEVWICGESGEPLADGEEGEIVIRSPGIAHGYEDDADGALIASSRFEGGVFFTGDFGVREDGAFRFRGRRKVMIAVSGRKVDPIEVEAVLMRHEGIADAAVTAHIEPGGREVVKAIVVARAVRAADAAQAAGAAAASPSPLGAIDVTDFCVRHLAAYKVPRIVEFRESLPRNALGKLLRARL
ncbi:MAG: class I adenylate-forming enzyme family protein [bacterium]